MSRELALRLPAELAEADTARWSALRRAARRTCARQVVAGRLERSRLGEVLAMLGLEEE